MEGLMLDFSRGEGSQGELLGGQRWLSGEL